MHPFKIYSSVVISILTVVHPSPQSTLGSFYSHKRNPIPFSTHPHLPIPFSPWQPLIYFWSLGIDLFCIFHVKGIIWDFHVWLISFNIMFCRFIPAVASALRSFSWLSAIPLCGYATFSLSIYPWWIFRLFLLFWPLWIMLLWTCVYKILHGLMCSFLLDPLNLLPIP